MKAADWFVKFLILNGTTEAFGLPGAVVLDLLYAMERFRPEFTPHLTYHEQGAGFAACGYAQASGKLGVAYATRGPGMTNMLTAMADAYYDSLPVMFVTAHSGAAKKQGMRVENNQEIDTVTLASSVAKYAVRVDRGEDLPHEVQRAYRMATEGRKGPVFLDISVSALCGEIETEPVVLQIKEYRKLNDIADDIVSAVRSAERPVFLIGNGVRQAGMQEEMRRLAACAGVPVLSSRSAQDILPDADMYFGFVGSHGTRYSNFILSKADVIVALGNRLAFPVNSPSFRPVAEGAKVIQVDVDETEFLREVPNTQPYAVDLRGLFPALLEQTFSYTGQEHWISVCRELKQTLNHWDRTPAVQAVMRIMEAAEKNAVFVCDVGNHSFWATNAYTYSNASNRILYSGSFGTLGSALPKAVGVCYGAKSPVFCFTGDQGVQMNIQELQSIGQNRLPVAVVVLNNCASAMIREREERKFKGHFVHTTPDSGYGTPDFRAIADAYQLSYHCITDVKALEESGVVFENLPALVEVRVDEQTPLAPYLPVGRPCQDLLPELPRELYQRLDALR